MAKLLLAKMASVATLVSTSFMLNGCITIAGKPIVCASGYTLKDGRCAKVRAIAPPANNPSKPKSAGGGANSPY